MHRLAQGRQSLDPIAPAVQLVFIFRMQMLINLQEPISMYCLTALPYRALQEM